jgi:hypothetical protein
MSTYDVHPPIGVPSPFSRRGRLIAVAVAAAIVLALVITAALYGSSGSSTSLPQQRDLAPVKFRDPQTHTLLWVTPTSASQPAGGSTLRLRPLYPGK